MPNPETKLSPSQVKPLEEVVAGFRAWQEQSSDPVLFAGHGTISDRPEDFFEDGIIIGRHDSLHETVVPLAADDQGALRGQLDHWPHRDSAHVVLVAAQSPHDYSKLGEILVAAPALWMEGLIQKTEKWGREVNHIPTDWVIGVYSRDTGDVTMNPNFSGREVTKADLENSGGYKYSMVGKTALDDMGKDDQHGVPDFSEAIKLPDPEEPIDIW